MPPPALGVFFKAPPPPPPAAADPTALLREYWQTKLRELGRPVELADDLVEYDRLLAEWHQFEDEHGMINMLCKDGPLEWKLARTLLARGQSTHGCWHSAVAMRGMVTAFLPMDVRQNIRVLNDRSLHSIVNAIFGLLHYRDNPCDMSELIPSRIIATEDLRNYCDCMRMNIDYFRINVWPAYRFPGEVRSSADLAAELV